jgi:threonyl-tRNA synthetase
MDDNYLIKLRHSCAHLLAAAVIKLYPHAKITLGPPIENGFYYDIDFGETPVCDKDLPKIEDKMKVLVKRWLTMKRLNLTKDEALKIWRDNPYKLELIDEIVKKGEPITAYQSGDFIDLCKGPHINHPNQELKHFKLLSIAGAYWRGDERNKMLTRIYGTIFPTKKELDQYLLQLEEAKRRDHRKLGKQLDLFLISNEVGPGLLIWTPKGAIVRRQIENLIIKEQTQRGYQHVYSPHIGRKSLWVTSGHWQLYQDKMYAPMVIDNEQYLVKPMNCPFHMMIYKSKKRSYRDLPIRIAENATVYRYEKAGELSGMLRVRYITQDDAHIFCREDQVIDEFLAVFDYIQYLLKAFHIDDYYLRLGVRSKEEKYLGSDNLWQKAQEKIIKAIEKKGLKYTESEGDAAFYGPKLDVIIKDSLARQWQCSTIQVDFMLPERFNLEYVDKDGSIKKPVLIHRAPLGSIERWVGLLIEHYGGAFPLWLSPVQVMILPLSEKHHPFALAIKQILQQNNFRVEADLSDKTISYKIRQSTLQKIPYMVIIGDKEDKLYQQEKKYYLSVRTREGKNLGIIDLYQFIAQLNNQLENFS